MTLLSTWAGSPAQAQPSDRFPVSVTTQIDGQRYEAFDLAGFTELLHIDADLVYYYQLNEVLVQREGTLQELADNLTLQVRGLLTQQELLTTERGRLRTMWSEANRRFHEAEQHVSVGSWLGWGFAAIFLVTSITLGFVVAYK